MTLEMALESKYSICYNISFCLPETWPINLKKKLTSEKHEEKHLT